MVTKHDKKLKEIAKNYESGGYAVQADLQGETQPKLVNGRRPDIYAEKGKDKVIIAQDLKLIQLKNLEIDYNLKIKKWNEENPKDKKDFIIWRKIKGIANQAFNTEFYAKTYGCRILKNKK